MQMCKAAGGVAVVHQALESCWFSVKNTRALMLKEPSLQLYHLPFYFLISFFKKSRGKKCLKQIDV